VKDAAPFLGVKMADVRACVHAWHRDEVDGVVALGDQVELALALFDGASTEEKLAGTLLIEEILIPAGAVDCASVDRFATLFAPGRIDDWNVCDWFCVKVLGRLVRDHGVACGQRIGAWRDAENVWQARASLVPFVKVAGDRDHHPAVEASCAVLIRRPERFAKTAVGWALREVSRHDPAFVRRLLAEHGEHFSRESRRNATKYLGGG
jgi:3-methyladenine DNA glycosylase AlkD